MKKLHRGSAGFTLIELMIVFVIIIVLATMVFRLMGLTGVRNAEAQTRERLERVANALEEFRATYGRYPPVDYYPGGSQPLEFEFPVKGDRSMPSSSKSKIVSDSKKENIWGGDGTGRVFTFGLLSYLFPRYNSHAQRSDAEFIGKKANDEYDKKNAIDQWYDYNDRAEGEKMADIVQNVESSRRILPYLGAAMNADGMVEKYGIVEVHPVSRWIDGASKKNNPEKPDYVNQQLIIRDGWKQTIHYQSRPPYDTYKLWSRGPDGVSGTDDDIVAGEG